MPGADEIAVEAYVFGYPLVIMDATRRLATSVAHATAQRAPSNQFAHFRAYPDSTFTDRASPNADTLYSLAWLDLSRGPIVLSVPDMGNRYYLMPLLDAWTNVFAAPGTRTTGNVAGDFAITGPGWSGRLPPKVTRIVAPTNMAWLLGRTETRGQSDYTAVRRIQERYSLRDLNSWGSGYRPPHRQCVGPWVDALTPPVTQVDRMDAVTFFSRLNALMASNPSAAADADAVARFSSVGIRAGQPIDETTITPALRVGVQGGRAKLSADALRACGAVVNGWEFAPKHTGACGTDYVWRAIAAMRNLGANLHADTVYVRATSDADGQPLIGTRSYSIRFNDGQLPPVNAFWSITLYKSNGTFADNSLGRHAVHHPNGLCKDGDGSIVVRLQRTSPGRECESNWLPTPADSFNLVLRLHWPSKVVLEGAWRPPLIKRET